MVKHPFACIVAIVFLLGGCDAITLSDSDHLQRAKAAFAQGDHRTGAIELKNALQKNPDNAEARWLLGRHYIDTGDGAAAEKELRKCVALGVAASSVQPHLARALLMQGKRSELLSMPLVSDLSDVDRAEIIALRGEAYLLERKPEQAEREFNSALELNPKSASAFVGKARLAAGYRKFDEATRFLDEAIAANPEEAGAWTLRGDIARYQSRPEEADAAYSKAIDLRLNDINDRYKRSIVRIYLKRYEAAQRDIETLRKLSIRHPAPHFAFGVFELSQNRIESAQTAFEQALQISDNHLPSTVYLGATHLMANNLGQADTYLSRFLASVPDHWSARKLLATVKLRSDKYGEAESLLRPSVAYDPNDAAALELLATALIRQGKTAEGVQRLKEVVALRPDSPDSRIRLGLGYLQEGDESAGLEVLQTALQLNPRARLADEIIILTHAHAGRFEQALKAVQNFQERYPDDPLPHVLHGTVLLDMKDAAGARDAFETALKVAPNDTAAHHYLAALDIEAGQLNRAQTRYESVLQSNPNHLSTLVRLAKLQRARGDVDGAATSLKKAAAAHPDALEPRVLLARLHLQLQDPQQALLAIGPLREGNRNHPMLLAVLGEIQLAQRQIQDAKSTLTQLTEVLPNEAQSHYLLARVYDALNDRERLKESLETALKLDSTHVAARIALLRLQLREQDLEAAQANLDEIKRTQPSSLEVMNLEGELAIARRDLTRAETAYRKAFQTAPTGRLAVTLAQISMLKGDTADAPRILEEWLQSHPSDVAVVMSLADVYTKVGREQDAISSYERVLELKPGNVIVLNNLALALRHRDPSRALKYAEQANAAAPRSVAVLDTYATLLIEKGDLEHAERLVDRALNVSAHPTVTYRKAVILKLTGRSDEARSLLRKLLSSKAPFDERPAAQKLLRDLGGL